MSDDPATLVRSMRPRPSTLLAALAALVVQRNVEWFWRERQAAPATGTRRAFPGSDVVFQLYAGNGWQLQPLANLGTLNALSRRRRITERTRQWAADLLDLAVR